MEIYKLDVVEIPTNKPCLLYTYREALRVLQAMGLVEIRHGKGAFVADRENAVTPEMWFQKYNYKVADIMQVRLPIEQMAVRLAAINMQEKELRNLQGLDNEIYQIVRCDASGFVICY